MEKIRKLSVIAGLLLLLVNVIAMSFDPYTAMPFIQEFIENEKTINFPLNYYSTASAILSTLFLISIILFYFFSWKGNRKAVAFLAACYLLDLALMMMEWKPVVNLEIVEYLTNLNAVTDGIIICTFIASRDSLSENKL
jgi:hypothetical protein